MSEQAIRRILDLIDIFIGRVNLLVRFECYFRPAMCFIGVSVVVRYLGSSVVRFGLPGTLRYVSYFLLRADSRPLTRAGRTHRAGTQG